MSDLAVKGAGDQSFSRYAMGIEYDGNGFYGWQKQKHASNTVQEVLESALSRVANEPLTVVCAGRTDTGVHGTHQVIHFETRAARKDRAWLLGTNTYLPTGVAVRWVRQVSSDFHARFSALERRYRYVICSAEVRPALFSRQVSWTYKSLDIARMQAGADYLLGQHDFSSYRAVACQAKSPVREIRSLTVHQVGHLIVIDVRANAFLQHMIRNIAGVLMRIGAGEAEPIWAQEVLEARDRRLGGVTAPPFGLYFVDVTYPERFDLPASDLGPVFLPKHL